MSGANKVSVTNSHLSFSQSFAIYFASLFVQDVSTLHLISWISPGHLLSIQVSITILMRSVIIFTDGGYLKTQSH